MTWLKLKAARAFSSALHEGERAGQTHFRAQHAAQRSRDTRAPAP